MMPTYEYRCANGHSHDLTCPYDDPTKALYDSGQMTCSAIIDREILTPNPDDPIVGTLAVESYACGEVFKRRFSLKFPRMMHEHFNDSVGQVISSDRQFRDALKKASDEQFRRTGFPADFQPVDLMDPAVAPKNDDGMKETHDAKVRAGIVEPTKKFM